MKPRRRRGLLLALVLTAGIAGTVAVMLHRMSGSSDGTVHVGTPIAGARAQSTKPIQVRTSYFATALPAGFRVSTQKESKDNPDALLSLVAIGGSSRSITFAAGVGRTPDSGITQLGDYALRARTPATYQVYTLADLPVGATAFRTIAGANSFVVFWPHGTNYAELALTTDGGDSYNQLDSIFSYLIQNWVWQ